MTARTFGKIEAIVHSHPKGGEASEMDWKACRNTKIPWYIYLVPEDKWLTINP
jgi:proteasome lid subunit RPN8/RPN11